MHVIAVFIWTELAGAKITEMFLKQSLWRASCENNLYFYKVEIFHKVFTVAVIADMCFKKKKKKEKQMYLYTGRYKNYWLS